MEHDLNKSNMDRAGIVSTPPVECDLKVGAKVTYTNDYGVVFPGHRVIGFSDDLLKWGSFIHLDLDCWWSPQSRDKLKTEP